MKTISAFVFALAMLTMPTHGADDSYSGGGELAPVVDAPERGFYATRAAQGPLDVSFCDFKAQPLTICFYEAEPVAEVLEVAEVSEEIASPAPPVLKEAVEEKKADSGWVCTTSGCTRVSTAENSSAVVYQQATKKRQLFPNIKLFPLIKNKK